MLTETRPRRRSLFGKLLDKTIRMARCITCGKDPCLCCPHGKPPNAQCNTCEPGGR